MDCCVASDNVGCGVLAILSMSKCRLHELIHPLRDLSAVLADRAIFFVRV